MTSATNCQQQHIKKYKTAKRVKPLYFYPCGASDKFQPTDDKLSLKGDVVTSRDLFNIRKISNNISKTVQDSFIIFIKIE